MKDDDDDDDDKFIDVGYDDDDDDDDDGEGDVEKDAPGEVADDDEEIDFNPQAHHRGKVKRYLAFGGKVAVAALGGYAAVRVVPPLFWLAARKLPPKIQVPLRRLSPRHERIGQGLLVAGGLSQNPYLLGIGGGMVASDVGDAVLRKREWIQDRGPEPGRLNFVRYNIPSWLPNHLKYDMIVDILSEIVTKPTWNEEQKVWIPPGREHPDVLAVAREIAQSASVDGHNKEAILRAVQSWVQQNIKYVYDPRWLDTYVHPYLVLRQKVGDCLPHDTLLLMSDYTLRPLIDVEVGESIIGRDGNSTRITNKWHKGWKKTLRVKLNNDTTLRVTADHRVLLENGTEKKAGELVVGDILLSFPRLPCIRREKRPGPICVIGVCEGSVEKVLDIETTSHSIYLPETDVVVHNCDCQAMLTASLAEALGIPMSFVLVSQREKGEFTHVLSAGVIDGKLCPVETIYPLSFGQMPENVDTRVYPIK